MDDARSIGSEGEPAKRTAEAGDSDQLMASLYDELRALAAEYLRRERPGHSLQPTALVHEAYVRLAKIDTMKWRDETHFYVAAAGTIRRVLVDHARGKRAGKRGGDAARAAQRVTLSGVPGLTGPAPVDLLALEEALEELTMLDERKARVVELRSFGGLTIEQAAESLGVSTTTVENDWTFARAWLHKRLRDQETGA